MSNVETRSILQARWVFPGSGPPIPDGMVAMEGDRIVAVSRKLSGGPVQDLGNVALLPGLVNAHAHLEFSGCDTPLGKAGMAFAEWIRLVVEFRRKGNQDFPLAVKQGLNESLACGTTALADVVTGDWYKAIEKQAIDVTVMREAIALSSTAFDARLNEAREHLTAANSSWWHAGLAPHAPYTVHPQLLGKLLGLAAEARVPLAFHLAESQDELELLAGGSAPLRELLVELGAWNSEAIVPGSRPLDYLRRLSTEGRSLVIHANYLDDEEIAYIAGHASRLTVVYCPRTHAWFAHPRHPLPRLLAGGAAVALGTDGRCSNPDLNLLAEMRFVARHYSEIPPNVVLELGTLRGARALGIEGASGSLEPGKVANLVAVRLPDDDAPDPHELVLDSSLGLAAVVVRGLFV